MSEAQRKAARKRWRNPEYRTRVSEAIRKSTQSSEYRKRLSELQTPERRTRVSEASRKMWRDPEYRTRHSQMMRKMWRDPERRARMSDVIRDAAYKRWDDPKQRAAWIKGMHVAGDRIAMGYQFANLIGLPKKDRDRATYCYLGKLIDEDRLGELGLPPVVFAMLCQKMIELGWV